jgi:hypothetical protein
MNWKLWLQGLLAAAVTAFSTAVSGALGLPTVFTWDKNGLINVLKLATIPTLLAFFGFLKQNPTPILTAEVDQRGNVTVKGNPVAEVEVMGKNEVIKP